MFVWDKLAPVKIVLAKLALYNTVYERSVPERSVLSRITPYILAPDKFAPDKSRFDKSRPSTVQCDQSTEPSAFRSSGTLSPFLSISLLQFWPVKVPSAFFCPSSISWLFNSDSSVIIPFDTSHCILDKNSASDIASVAHHPAVFFTQSGTFFEFSGISDTSTTTIISSLIKNSIALTNSVSEIASVAHHSAVFFTHDGTYSAYIIGDIPTKSKTTISNMKLSRILQK